MYGKKSDQGQLRGFAQTSWEAGALLTSTGRLWGEQVWKHQSCEGPSERLVESQAAVCKRKRDAGLRSERRVSSGQAGASSQRAG